MNSELLDKVVALAQCDDDVRAVILEGSFAVKSQVDDLSDYDVNIFVSNAEKYLEDDAWMSKVGEVLVYQKEQFLFYEDTIPTRLVLFCDRERVDFSFWRLGILAEMVRGEKVYESYRNGYMILLDKDGLAARLPPEDGRGFTVSQPDRSEFLMNIYDFWFDAYCTARCLARGDLWFARQIEDCGLRDYVFQMALWEHQLGRGWQSDPRLHTGGKRFEQWASTEVLQALPGCFAGFYLEETWNSLYHIIELYHRMAQRMCRQLEIPYPERVKSGVLDYIQYLQNRQKPGTNSRER
jgi:aminoglycoside 6-adenylyltransferase